MRTLSIALLLVLLAIFALYPHTTGPTEVGVRIIKWSLFAKKGVESHVYEPGALYFFPLVLNDWRTFDTKLQNVEMTHDPNAATSSIMMTCCSRPSTATISAST